MHAVFNLFGFYSRPTQDKGAPNSTAHGHRSGTIFGHLEKRLVVIFILACAVVTLCLSIAAISLTSTQIAHQNHFEGKLV